MINEPPNDYVTELLTGERETPEEVKEDDDDTRFDEMRDNQD